MELLLSRSLIITPDGLRRAPLHAPDFDPSVMFIQDFCEDFPLIAGSLFVDALSLDNEEVDVIAIVSGQANGAEVGWMEVAQGGLGTRLVSVASFQQAVKRKRYRLLPSYVSSEQSIYNC